MNNLNSIILAPIITEKSIVAQSRGVYSFWVSQKANKSQIAEAFETVFKTKPLMVRTMQVKGKVKNDPRRRLTIQKPDKKRAIITVSKDTKLELMSLSK